MFPNQNYGNPFIFKEQTIIFTASFSNSAIPLPSSQSPSRPPPPRVVWLQSPESLGHATDCAGRSCSRRPFFQRQLWFLGCLFYREGSRHKKMSSLRAKMAGHYINIWKMQQNVLNQLNCLSFLHYHLPFAGLVCKGWVCTGDSRSDLYFFISPIYSFCR